MTPEELWASDGFFGRPIRVGEWRYDGKVPLAVRLFQSDVLYGTGDDYDEAEDREDRHVHCSYMEFEVPGEQRWGSRRAFMSLEEIESFGRNELGDSLQWLG